MASRSVARQAVKAVPRLLRRSVPALAAHNPGSGKAVAAIASSSTYYLQPSIRRGLATETKVPAFVLDKKDKFFYEDRPVPELTSEHDVLIQVCYTGICGSDMHYWTEGAIGDATVDEPLILGHESAGIVQKVGNKVRSVKEGDRVALEVGVTCGKCSFCKTGNYHLCQNVEFAGTPPVDGTLKGHYVLPEELVYKLPDSMSMEEGALLEPLSVAVHIVRQADVKPGNSVVVTGAGPVGLLSCAVAAAFGATKIVAVDVIQQKLDFAKEYYTTGTYLSSGDLSPEENAKELLRKYDLGEYGADVAIEASGAEPSVGMALAGLRPGGTYVQGGLGKSLVQFPIVEVANKEITVKGSMRYCYGEYPLAIELVQSGRVDVKKLMSEKVKFGDAERAFHLMKEGKVQKVIIEGPEV